MLNFIFGFLSCFGVLALIAIIRITRREMSDRKSVHKRSTVQVGENAVFVTKKE